MRAICIDPRTEGSRLSDLERFALPRAEVITVASVAEARALIADGQGCALVLTGGLLPAGERDSFTDELSRMTPPVPLIVLGEVPGARLSGRPPASGETVDPEAGIASALRNSGGPSSALVDGAPVIILMLDPDGRIEYMNPYFEQLSGYLLDEVKGKDWFETFLPKRDHDEIRRVFASTVEGTPTMGYVNALITRSAGERLIEWFARTITDPGDQHSRVLCFGQDVTDRQRADAELREARDGLDAILQAVPDLLFEIDETGRFVDFHSRRHGLLGLSREAFAGKTLHEVLPEAGAVFLAAAEKAAREGVSYGHEYCLSLGDQATWFEASIARKGGPDREHATFVLLVRDITDRKRVEQALRASEERLRSILDGMFAYISLYSPDGVMLEVNRHTLEQWGLPREEMVGRKPWEAERWARSPRRQEGLRLAYERAGRGETIRGDTTARLTDGREVTTDSTLQPLLDEQGRVTGILSFAVDVSERRRAEEKLRESELRLTEAQRIAGIGNWELDLVSGALHWSDEIFRLFEIDKEQFGASYDAFLGAIHPDDRDAVDAAYTRSLETREPYEISHRLRMADGRIKYVEERCESFWDDDGRALRSVGTVQDVTERFLVQEALRQSEETAAALLNAYTDMVMLVDIDGVVLAANEGAERALASPGRVLVGRCLFDALPPEMAERRRGWTREIIAMRAPLNRTDSYNGHTYDNRAYPLLGDDGGVARIAVYVRDITEQVMAEEALHLEHAAIESSINAIAMAGLDGNLVYINGSFLDLWGLNSVDDALGRSVVDFWRDPTQPSSVVEALFREGYWTGEMEGVRANGTLFTAMVSAHMVVDLEGNPTRMMASFVDISPIKAAEAVLRGMNASLEVRVRERTAQLEVANRELETFTYSVSHDLKAPLRSIDGYSRLLMEDHAGQLDDEGVQFLRNVRQATTQMGGLIDDLLAYSRLERRSVSSEPVDVRALAEALWRERAAAGKGGATITFDFACDTMVADRDALTLALRNLLENAVKFMGDNAQPMIEVGGGVEGPNCILWVRDNGIGFDMKFHDRIFDIFQRLHRAEEYPGTGIGLAIVRKAVERMGGRVWAESQPGEGATFYIEVPR